jgi:hypothetical protein
VLLALALGGAGGWLLRLPYAPDRDARALALLEQQGLATHEVYAADNGTRSKLPLLSVII